jgi:hypothetical protein
LKNKNLTIYINCIGDDTLNSDEIEIIKIALKNEYIKKLLEDYDLKIENDKIVAKRTEEYNYFDIIRELIRKIAEEKADRWIDNNIKKTETEQSS